MKTKALQTKQILLPALFTILILTFLFSFRWFGVKPTEPTDARTLHGIAVLGDSFSDEYRADDDRGGVYKATTLNWLEILVKSRNLPFGRFSNTSWGDVRRRGYEYNWARTAATAQSMIASNQHQGAASQVRSGKVDLVFIEIGVNNFAHYYQQFGQIYNGTWNQAQVDGYVNEIIDNITLAVDTVNVGATVIVSTIPDPTLSLSLPTQYRDPQKLAKVKAVVGLANSRIKTMANQKGVALFDFDKFAEHMLAKVDNRGRIKVGNEYIKFVGGIGDEPHNAILGDGIHSGTVMAGLFANYWLDFVNNLVGESITPLTDSEILTLSGIIVSSPVSTITPTSSPTSSPVSTATASPKPTATPGYSDPFKKYCPTFLRYREQIKRLISKQLLAEWDARCSN